MKKILAIVILIFSSQLFGQSFYKGAFVINANVGIDAYAVKYHYQLIGTNYTHDENNGAAAANIGLGAEYGFNKWFGLGLRGRFNNYATKYDSTTHATPTAQSIDLALALNAHVVHVTHFDLPLGFDVGYSHLVYQNSNDIVYGNGPYFNLHINPRFYIKKFGFNINLAIPFVHYNDMTSNNSLFNQYILADWKAAGFSFSFGIQYRFGTVK